MCQLQTKEQRAISRQITVKKYVDKNRDKLNANRRADYAANPKRYNAISAQSRLRNPNTERNGHLRRNFNITLVEYNVMLEAQTGLCAICKEKETTHSHKGKEPQYLAVDHNHTTGKIRGLLCFKCNTTLHYFEKNKEVIINIENYLRSNS